MTNKEAVEWFEKQSYEVRMDLVREFGSLYKNSKNEGSEFFKWIQKIVDRSKIKHFDTNLSRTIAAPKQPNGLWGSPYALKAMDAIPMKTSGENWVKHTAIVLAIAQEYPDETFEIFWTDENGFFVKLSESGINKIRYDDYELNGNILTWIKQ